MNLIKEIAAIEAELNEIAPSPSLRRFKARGAYKCRKGYNCGGSCISRNYGCRKALSGEAKNFSEWMVAKMTPNIPGILGEAPADTNPLENIDRGDYKSLTAAGAAFTQGMNFDEDEVTRDRLEKEKDQALLDYKSAYSRMRAAREKRFRDGITPVLGQPMKEETEWVEARDLLRQKQEEYDSTPFPQTDALKQKIIDHHRAKGYTREQALASASKTQTDRFNFGRGRAKGKPLGKKALKEYQDTAADVFELSGGKASDQIDYAIRAESRAWALSKKTSGIDKGFVNVGSGSRNDTFHEVAHHIEYEDPDIAKASKDFVMSRATGEPEFLSDLTGDKSYGAEMAYPDKFVSPYVGKVTGKESSEVISMGVERMATSKAMQQFMKEDPEHFNFVMGVLLS